MLSTNQEVGGSIPACQGALGHVSKSLTCHHKYLDRWKYCICINGVPFILWLSISTQFRVPVVLEIVWVVYQCVGLWFKSLGVPLSLKDSLRKILKFLLMRLLECEY